MTPPTDHAPLELALEALDLHRLGVLNDAELETVLREVHKTESPAIVVNG